MATFKLTNNVLLDSESVRMGLDPNDLLYTRGASNTPIAYTATKDCYVSVYTGQWGGYPSINDTDISTTYGGTWGGFFFLRKGDTFKTVEAYGNLPQNSMKVFGIK